MKINMDTIITDENPLLREKAKKVSLPLSIEDEKLIADMIQYVRDSRNEELAEKYNYQASVGLAAPQLGILKRIFVVSVDDYDDDGNPINTTEYAFVNPVLKSYSQQLGALEGGEGCLSVRNPHPGYVNRPYRIKINGYDALTKQDVSIRVQGYLATVIQHELDHLNGILFYDRINKEDPWLKDENIIYF